MSETKRLLERGAAGFHPAPPDLAPIIGRATRRQRWRRLGTIVLAFALFAASAAGVWLAFDPGGPNKVPGAATERARLREDLRAIREEQEEQQARVTRLRQQIGGMLVASQGLERRIEDLVRDAAAADTKRERRVAEVKLHELSSHRSDLQQRIIAHRFELELGRRAFLALEERRAELEARLHPSG